MGTIDTTTTSTSESIILVRMDELGIKRLELLPQKSGHSEVDKVIRGIQVSIQTAILISDRLYMPYDDLFDTVQSKNHHSYARPKMVDDGDVYYGNNNNDSYDVDVDGVNIDGLDIDVNDKSTVKQYLTVQPTIKPRSQSTCAVCGSLSTHFTNVHDREMCVRCASIPRCADCLRPAYTLYVVGGATVCPQCESVRKQKVKASK